MCERKEIEIEIEIERERERKISYIHGCALMKIN